MTYSVGQFVRNFMCLFVLSVAAACSTPQPTDAAPYAAIVQDARTGEVLFADNADARLHPASLTKMMTLYIAFREIERGKLSLDTMVTVSKSAAAKPPSRLGLKAGQKIALRYLIRAAAIKSANDAASAIGDHIGGTEAGFSDMMTATARAIGMKNTAFKNANGLTANGHLSSARDMNTLGRRLFYDYPQYYNIFSRRSTDAGLAQVNNTNTRFLDAYKGADGIKTGFTNAAGFNLTASAERGSVRIIATVFGGASTAQRNAKMAGLMDLGFRKAPANAPVNRPPAPSYQGGETALVAEAAPEATGGAAKTIRLITAVASSPRPKARPGATPELKVAAKIAVAGMVEGIEGALAEAIAPPAPDGTLEAQVAALAADTAPQTAAKSQTQLAEPVVASAALASPPPRPVVQLEDVPFEVVTEFSVEAPAGTDPVLLAEAGGEDGPMAISEPIELAAVTPVGAAIRNAPIFERSAERPAARPAEPEVVVRLSTSNGRHWGVNVGRFNSRDAAERAVLKTQLAEAVTLNDGLRKVVQRSGGFDANVMGLTQDQADLACRRLQARAIQCFTMGP